MTAEYEPENWVIAVNNENFRKTIFHAFNRAEYIAAEFPGDDPAMHLLNTVTPKGFAINPDNGRDYVTYGGLAKYTDGDSFNEALALEYKAKAVEELTAAGATFPIKMPINYRADSNNWANATVVMEQQIEKLLGTDFVDVIPSLMPETASLTKPAATATTPFRSSTGARTSWILRPGQIRLTVRTATTSSAMTPMVIACSRIPRPKQPTL